MSARPRRAAAEAPVASAHAYAAAGRKRGRTAAEAVDYNEDSGPEEEEEEPVAVQNRPTTLTTPSLTFNPSAALRRLRARWPGRDQQIIALLSALGSPGDRAPHMLVHGPQATGKTSIVRCGNWWN